MTCYKHFLWGRGGGVVGNHFFQEALVNRSLFNEKKGMYYVGKRSEKVAEFSAAWLVLMGLHYYAASKIFKNFMAHRVFFVSL